VISSLTFDLLKVVGKKQNGGSMMMNPMVESFNNHLKQIQTFNPQKNTLISKWL